MQKIKAKRILIVNIYGIGDVLFTTPLIRNIKLNIPDAHIGYVVNRRTAPLFENHPLINKLYIYERDEYQALYRRSHLEFFKKIFVDLQAIRKDRYDLVIDLSLNGSAAFLMWLIGIPVRAGYDYKKRGLFLNRKIPFAGYEDRHVVDYYLALLESLGFTVSVRKLEFFLKEEDKRWAGQFLAKSAGKPLIALVPGGGASWGKDAAIKRWPAEKYANLADKIVEKYSAAVILLGDESEKSLAAQVSAQMRHKARDLSGETNLRQFAAIVACCDLVILNDGGPLHMSVAAGAETIAIFGPVDEKVYGPYPPEQHQVVSADIPCRPCYRKFRRARCEHISCIQTIEVEDVFAQIRQVLDRKILKENTKNAIEKGGRT